jgi:hypothetical protein
VSFEHNQPVKMKFSRAIALLGASASFFGGSNASPFSAMFGKRGDDEKIAPKFVIISMFTPEATVWWGIKEFNLIAVSKYEAPGSFEPNVV